MRHNGASDASDPALLAGVKNEVVLGFACVPCRVPRCCTRRIIKSQVPRSLLFLRGTGADGDDISWFRKRIFISEVFIDGS